MEYQTVIMPEEVKKARADQIEQAIRLVWIAKARYHAQEDRVDKLIHDVFQFIPMNQKIAVRDAIMSEGRALYAIEESLRDELFAKRRA